MRTTAAAVPDAAAEAAAQTVAERAAAEHASDSPAIAWTVSPDVRADPTMEMPVLLDLRGGQCHALNALGACIWRLLAEADEGLTDAALTEALRPLVSGAPPDLLSEVRAFRESLTRKGLVRPSARRARIAAAPASPADAADAVSSAGAAGATNDRSDLHGTTRSNGANSTPAIPVARVTVPPLLCRVRRLPVQLVSAYSLLIVSDVVMRIGGVRGLRALSSRVRWQSTPADDASSVASAQALAQTMARAAAWYYKHAWCLHRAVATSCFLRLHGIAATVCIGFHAVPFYGHAWVEVQDTVIDDRPAVRSRYRIVERF